MEDQYCPRCRTTKYRNPSLKLMVNICGHTLCETCVDLLFIRGSGACPECGTALRRNDFRLQLFEDPLVEKEVDIRKKILKDFNKKEEDFESLREYNDYLEEIETIIFNLVNGVDTEATKRKIEQYKKVNRESITKNRSKLSKDEELIEYYLEHERVEAEARKQQQLLEEVEEKRKKKKDKESLIDDLMFSDMPASMIIASHKEHTAITRAEESKNIPKQAATAFSTGIKVGHGHHNVFVPIPKVEGILYSYTPLVMDTCGPPVPDLEHTGYLANVPQASSTQQAGGFQAIYSCQRALQEALCGLFFQCDVSPSPAPSSSSSDSHADMDIG
ncbi:CDK-activating kinase assembly factor MAT1 [Lingula anatina]|uniref:CDK-activating kinase assembly factor MAT1 n=1 Tax=Lingula anatina TaxID=7574 RepID=A0A1S3ILJ6_LINAN|nr:CDK-activating kinase assembly factor MAT1 [Lingula anatina]|eukprot:XP_013399115.1 CDK-activating kinase assembly factor MAT1 [Lingula anatina]